MNKNSVILAITIVIFSLVLQSCVYTHKDERGVETDIEIPTFKVKEIRDRENFDYRKY